MVSYADFKVDALELAKAARKQAEDRPDHIYHSANWDEYNGNNGCNYTERDNTLGCIFGHAMADLGKPLPAALSPESVQVGGLTGSYINAERWLEAFGLNVASYEVTPAVVLWMRAVQAKQDDGATWRDSIAYGDQQYPHVFPKE